MIDYWHKLRKNSASCRSVLSKLFKAFPRFFPLKSLTYIVMQATSHSVSTPGCPLCWGIEGPAHVSLKFTYTELWRTVKLASLQWKFPKFWKLVYWQNGFNKHRGTRWEFIIFTYWI